MDPGSADDYWLAEFVGEEGSWVSKYLQDINIVDEGNHSVEESPKPVENTISTEFSSMSAPNSSSLVIQKCHPVTRGPERIPFDRKWELLKSEIERLYITENVLLRDIIGIMKEKYDFDAIESQYKYHFKKWWGSRKNIRSSDKRALIRIAQERAKIGKMMVATYKGRPVETRKLQREAKKMARGLLQLATVARNIESHPRISLLPSVFASTNGIFLKWNIPRDFLHLQTFDRANRPSSSGAQISVPKDFHIHSPPAFLNSQHEGTSPFPPSAAVASIDIMKRASMFLQGRHNELAKSMSRIEASTMSIFLYQFWLFGFTTAKNWGRGPRAWNAINLGFLDWQSSSQDLAARSVDSRESGAHDGTEIFLVSHDVRATDIATPYQFCRWSRHPEYELVEYQARAPASELHNVMKTAQKSSGSELKGEHWPESWKAPPFEERLKGNLERSDFCSINPSKVPLSMPAVVQAVKESPNELLEEAIGFSIMGRNASLLYDLLRKAKKTNLVSSNLNPFHLATSYLDGSKTCCLILDILFHHAPDEWKKEIRIRNSNDLGHTLLDTLMITILRNHTSVSPDTLDNALKRGHIFPGQETDICGRWDADSRCYQQLLLSGKHAIPSTWKHKFCHTSAQAVCHSIAVMHFGVDLEAPSGLFLKHCSYCGAKLQLSSLHTLVMTSFYLATAGCENEDLFGAIACLLNLLACEVDPRETSKISLSILLGSHERYNCSHDDLTPVEFAEALARESVEEWPDVTKTGWQILCHILRIAEEIHDDFPLDFDSQSESGDAMENDLYESEENSIVPGFSLSCSHHNGYEPMEPKPFGQNRILGHLWAAAQTELLTHRRQCEEDPWTSEKFDLSCVLKRLKERTKPTIPLVKGSMMKPYCACGFFEGCFSTVPPTRRKACPACVSNMIRYSRQTWIDEEILWK